MEGMEESKRQKVTHVKDHFKPLGTSQSLWLEAENTRESASVHPAILLFSSKSLRAFMEILLPKLLHTEVDQRYVFVENSVLKEVLICLQSNC